MCGLNYANRSAEGSIDKCIISTPQSRTGKGPILRLGSDRLNQSCIQIYHHLGDVGGEGKKGI